MENASKALLIAAAVLVAIIIIAIGMKIYISSTETGKVAMDTGKTITDKTGEATDLATYEITGKKANNIKYFNGETEEQKSKENVQKNDTITIGTEKFMVFLIDEEGIKAMPYYNLKLDSNPIKQATAETADYAGECQFSTSEYWRYDENNQQIPNWDQSAVDNILDINMNDSRNIVQTYVNSYKNTLEKMGGNGIEVRCITKEELPFTNYTANYSERWRNPSGIGDFWTKSVDTGTSPYISKGNIYFVTAGRSTHCTYSSGHGYDLDNKYGAYRGVRPIIIIPK